MRLTNCTSATVSLCMYLVWELFSATALSVQATSADSAALVQPSTFSQPEITNLDQLLDAVRQQQNVERDIEHQREREFLHNKHTQQFLLDKAKRNFDIAQKDNNPLQKITELNEQEIKELQYKLQQRTEEMGDIYSIFNEFSGDFATAFNSSMTAIEFPERSDKVNTLLENDALATIADMQSMWLLLQEDMTAASKIQQLTVPVVNTDGISEINSVIRAGTFTVFSEGKFLRYIAQVGELLALDRQPASRYVATINDFDMQSDVQLLSIDPTGGSLLGLLAYSPNVRERIEQGGMIGKIILALGFLGLIITAWRAVYLSSIYVSIKAQQKRPEKAKDNNPLGRVILSAQAGLNLTALAQDGHSELEALQFKLDEAVLLEVPNLERGHNFIKLLAAISPLLGLLGTVTGMIVTFQAISLFGSGDPKLMASGISQALMTTVLGLVVAIPLLFGHSFVAALARTMIQRLDEQSAGIIVQYVTANQHNK
ncbi:MAG: biopolymer transport protein ExbB [Paraglaciecola sp.]|jgi:biopolymer transport protein ExbB